MLFLCNKINAPVKSSKVEGPSTTLTFLGILLDTTTMEASITQDRKQALLSELLYLRHRQNCTKRELLSLIGKLSFCCKVLPAGRIFLRRLIDLSTTVSKLHHHLSLTVEAKLDLQWWLDFLSSGQEKASFCNLIGFTVDQCNSIQMLLAPRVGELTGQVDGCNVAGQQPSKLGI